MTFDVKINGELQSDAFLHCLLQSWDLLPSKLLPVNILVTTLICQNVYKYKQRN